MINRDESAYNSRNYTTEHSNNPCQRLCIESSCIDLPTGNLRYRRNKFSDPNNWNQERSVLGG